MNPEAKSRLFTADEVAALLRQSRPTTYRQVANGALRALRIGEHGRLRIPEDAVAELLKPVHEENSRG